MKSSSVEILIQYISWIAFPAALPANISLSGIIALSPNNLKKFNKRSANKIFSRPRITLFCFQFSAVGPAVEIHR